MNQLIRLYLLGYKGYSVLKSIVNSFDNNIIKEVIYDKDNGVDNDFYKEIVNLCFNKKIQCIFRKQDVESDTTMSIAIGWKHIIDLNRIPNLIVLHDSLLPKYRGFNPLVSALINGEKNIGVTAIFATKEYDRGDIIYQYSIGINYPIKICDAIKIITNGYNEVVIKIVNNIVHDCALPRKHQKEDDATYSLWRDELDYRLNWNFSSDQILRFINAVGTPYKGASTNINNMTITILEAVNIEDVKIENRCPGKVLFVEDGNPIVVCGEGLIKIKKMVNRETLSPYRLKSIKTRFI